MVKIKWLQEQRILADSKRLMLDKDGNGVRKKLKEWKEKRDT